MLAFSFIGLATVPLERSLSLELYYALSKVTTNFFFGRFSFPDRHLREKLLPLSQKRLQAAHEKRFEVSDSCFLWCIFSFHNTGTEMTPCPSLLTVNTIV